MQYLATDERYSREGKMYGILLILLPNGEQRILRAFSGLLNSCSVVEGWVPPIPGHENVALDEARTLKQLEVMKQELRHLKQLTERQEYETQKLEFELQRKEISDRHQIRKQQRIVKRQILKESLDGESLTIALEKLDEESRQDGIEARRFKQKRDEKLQPLKQLIDSYDERMRELKQQRQKLSRQLQTQMHAAYSLMNFFGRSLSLQQLMPSGLPTGTGDCCAPKLLHYAATHNLKPLAMAEFWWGDSSSVKIQGQFYGACTERCQPLMGFLLSGLAQRIGRGVGGVGGEGEQSEQGEEGERENTLLLPIIYEDKWLIAVNKPPGLLSVPGRYHETQDSVLLRLRNLLPDGMSVTAVHRLDGETSGILLLARNKEISSQLSQQFEKRQVRKVYEAVLDGCVNNDAGVIELPLWGDSYNRPYQQVNWQYGKPSITKFQVMAREGNYTRVEFIPLTGRTHQLRVHAADARGLGVPILGDRLYGCSNIVGSRLHLHARELSFEHPELGDLHLQVETPF